MIKILISNDDGIDADGIRALAIELSKTGAHITVCAPDSERSASGHAISLRKPISFKQANVEGASAAYAVNGTPADCIKLGINHILKGDVDIVVSGINHGQNLGTDVFYSGTVSAAMEGVINGYKSVALSQTYKDGYKPDYRFAAKLFAANIGAFMDAEHGFYNINFPACDKGQIKGVKFAPLAKIRYVDEYTNADGADGGVLLVSPSRLILQPEHKSDIYYVQKNYVTVTPLSYEITDFDALAGKNPDFKIIT